MARFKDKGPRFSTVALMAILNYAWLSSNPSPLYAVDASSSSSSTESSSSLYNIIEHDLMTSSSPQRKAATTTTDYNVNLYSQLKTHLDERQSQIENSVFVSYNFNLEYQTYTTDDSDNNNDDSLNNQNFNNNPPYPSKWYNYQDFTTVLESMSIYGVGAGPSSKRFYIGQTTSETNKGLIHGLVNTAAFLAHAMTISIKYDVCDEFHMDDEIENQFAISNSCGQYGGSYDDDDVGTCSIGGGSGSSNSSDVAANAGDNSIIIIPTCPVDLDISITAASSLFGETSPPPLQCQPKESETDFTGYWNVMEGLLEETFPYSNRAGRIDTAGCCFWGRGILLTRGTCNFGKMNYYLGNNAASQGFLNWFDVDFCVYPEIVCEGPKELRWAVGYLEWADRVQDYVDESTGWGYMQELEAFVERNFGNSSEFIDVVGDALAYGCLEEEPDCEEMETKVRYERRENFRKILFDIFQVSELKPTPPPTPLPTNPPIIFYPPTQSPVVTEVLRPTLTNPDGSPTLSIPIPVFTPPVTPKPSNEPVNPNPVVFVDASPTPSQPPNKLIFDLQIPTDMPTYLADLNETELISIPSGSAESMRCSSFLVFAATIVVSLSIFLVY